RERVYGDLWYRDRVRIFAEFIDADTFNQDLPPLVTDRNHGDFLNLFADVKLFDVDDHPVYFRGGRQELLYGSERLISPLDWANDRRTFQGGKLFYRGDKLDVDLFLVQPVVPDPQHFDSVDNEQVFSGLWNTYRPRQGQFMDFYYLNLDNTHPVARGRNGAVDGFNVNTFGSRYAGYANNLLFDFEGMLQFGSWSNQSTLAEAYRDCSMVSAVPGQ
ncbi:MAG: alginate export family protein, partial [Acetobacteraceae bacterium]|nr:alginate export family protein [Acetobacteraceae bacterium]